MLADCLRVLYQTRRDFSKVGGLLRKRARTSDFDTLVSTYSCSMWNAQAWGPTRRYYYPVVMENLDWCQDKK